MSPPRVSQAVALRRAWPLLAVLLVAAATTLTALLGVHSAATPYAIYYLAVFVAAVYGGVFAAGLAMGLSALTANYLFVPPRFALALGTDALLSAGLFAVVATLLALLVHRLRQRDLAVRQLNRLYSALGRINQGIVRLPTSDELFDRVCHVLVQDGGFRLAWITWHDAERRVLVPVAQAGDTDGFLDAIHIASDDRPEGRGPSGTAFRDGRAVICNDLLDDPATAPWRAEVRSRGFRASAALPIRVHGEPAGTLTVIADSDGYFGEKEVALLEQAAADLSFGLDNLAREEARREAARAAERERRFSTTLLESVPGILYLYNEQGRFLRWNRTFEDVSGYTGAEISGMHPLAFFSEGDRPLLAERIGRVFAGGEASVEASFVAKNGTSIPYFFTGKRILFEGEVCLVGMGIDISERMRAEAELRATEQRFHAFMDASPAIAWMTDEEGRHLYMNRAWNEAFGLDRGDWIGKTAFDLVPTEAAERIRRSDAEVLERDQMIEIEDDTGVLRGRPFHWNCFKFPFRNAGGQRLIGGIAIDITARREAEQERARAEAALRDALAGLEVKVAERTAELKSALVRAEAADRLKSAFLATMSHELRTPLNSILGFTGLLLQGLAGPLNEEQHKQLSMVRTSARHLLDLIGDVLDISKIEAGQLEVRAEPVDLAASIARVTGTVQPMAEKKGLTLRAELPAGLSPLISDRRRVEQILLNLLNNAVKFTNEGGVTLTAGEVDAFRSAPGDAPRPAVRIRVTDTGSGIKPDDLVTLFQPFRQIDTGLTRHHEGTGLGLAICRRLAELLGGTIGVESVWGEGSTFTVTLPLAKRM